MNHFDGSSEIQEQVSATLKESLALTNILSATNPSGSSNEQMTLELLQITLPYIKLSHPISEFWAVDLVDRIHQRYPPFKAVPAVYWTAQYQPLSSQTCQRSVSSDFDQPSVHSGKGRKIPLSYNLLSRVFFFPIKFSAFPSVSKPLRWFGQCLHSSSLPLRKVSMIEKPVLLSNQISLAFEHAYTC